MSKNVGLSESRTDRSRQCENQMILPGLWTRAVQKLAMANWHHRLGLTCSTYLNIFQDGEILELTMWKCFPVTCVSACDLSACNHSRLTNRHWKDFACTNMCTSYVHESRQMSNWRDIYTVYHSMVSFQAIPFPAQYYPITWSDRGVMAVMARCPEFREFRLFEPQERLVVVSMPIAWSEGPGGFQAILR